MAQSVLRKTYRSVRRAVTPKVCDAEYAERYRMTIADWMCRHQKMLREKRFWWMGVETLKNPLDCWIYQEMLHEIRPDVLIEIGSYNGGSTLFFAHLLDIIGHGEIVTLDIDHDRFEVEDPRITAITGDSGSPEIVKQVHTLTHGKRTMLIHDGDHESEAVLRDMRLYADIVSVGSYMVIEDGVVDVFEQTTPVGWKRPGPLDAIEQFLDEDDRFDVDEERERFLITWSPRGFLKRVK